MALYLVVDIAGERVAIPSASVESVVELEGLTPVPGAAAHIAGLSALRSRVLTVVDCRAALELPMAEGTRREAIVATIGGHPYALLVDRVEDVMEGPDAPAPATTVLAAGWKRAARGTVELGGDVLLTVDPAAFIEGPAREAA
ncbi:MAG TPA: chemotaxis protein CheW [Allosphingosinicella sp.]